MASVSMFCMCFFNHNLFWLLPLPPPRFPLPLVFPSNTERAVTIATPFPYSASSSELELLDSALDDISDMTPPLVSSSVSAGEFRWHTDPMNPPANGPVVAGASSGCEAPFLPFLDGELSSSSSSSSLSFLLRQVTALRRRWLWIDCLSCCSRRKNESMRSCVCRQTITVSR